MILSRKGGKIPSKKEKAKDKFDWFEEFDDCNEILDGYCLKGKEK